MVPAKGLARARAALRHGHARRQIDEVQAVGRWVRDVGAGRHLVLQHVLNRPIGDGMVQRRLRDRYGTGALAVANRVPADIVFRHLVNQRAGQDEVKKLVQLLSQNRLRRCSPGRAPKDRIDLYRSQQRAIAIG